mmetsp:Transcript_42781/g.93222  ORF Transcript_42781/g.93222 Transcript_42781/m.93222 type:complete len:372 (+) Transcript_42781:808-1923(+)
MARILALLLGAILPRWCRRRRRSRRIPFAPGARRGRRSSGTSLARLSRGAEQGRLGLPLFRKVAPKLFDQQLEERPLRRDRRNTPECNLRERLREKRWEVASRVEHLQDLGRAAFQVVHEVAELVRLVWLLNRRRCTSQQLQKYHAVAVHFAPLSDDPGTDILRARVAHRATGLLNLELCTLRDTGQAEVGHLCGPVLVKQYVWPLDVSMESSDWQVVEVREPTCRIERCTEPHLPVKLLCTLTALLESLADVAASQVLIHQASSTRLHVTREAHEDHEVRVTEAREHPHLLLEASLLGHLQDFDGNLRAVSHGSLVHAAEGSRSKETCRTKIPGCRTDVLLRVLDTHIVQVVVGPLLLPVKVVDSRVYPV